MNLRERLWAEARATERLMKWDAMVSGKRWATVVSEATGMKESQYLKSRTELWHEAQEDATSPPHPLTLLVTISLLHTVPVCPLLSVLTADPSPTSSLPEPQYPLPKWTSTLSGEISLSSQQVCSPRSNKSTLFVVQI